jgi:hypothetical protein
MGFLDLMFGCPHKRFSFPITVRGARRRNNEAASVTGTYVVCLECGHEFPYDWDAMKMVRSSASTSTAVATQSRRAA